MPAQMAQPSLAAVLHQIADHWVTNALVLAAKRRAGRLSDEDLELQLAALSAELITSARREIAPLRGETARTRSARRLDPVEVAGEILWASGEEGHALLRQQGEALRALLQWVTDRSDGAERGR